jgi:hypothetical protein
MAFKPRRGESTEHVPHSAPIPKPRRPRRHAALWLACILLAIPLEFPIAWACARIGSRNSPPWDYVSLFRPVSIDSDTERLQLGSISHFGVKIVSVEAIPMYTNSSSEPMPSSFIGAELFSQVQPGSPRVIAACSPWQPEQLHPALLDSSAWPKRTGVYSRPNLIHTEPLAFRIASGWPMLCVEGRIEYTSPRTYDYIGILTSPRFLPPPTAETGYLCYLPRWPGLLIDSLINGTILTLVVLAIGTLGRKLIAHNRRRRNLCPTCAYDLRHTAADQPCPECGTPRPHIRT